ncbi:uncharacterized protein LOC133371197 isoform X2 [Rhineura floridana]|uniref:uncharacterized protein LOC133371197 isoform X2 n=1 Tax=Rhineura floridana TaxID=261503 RepID=UPI002AC85B76|nr:uncharacterized protein LOC133371197 isoform X2 [Rhineura floridana]
MLICCFLKKMAESCFLAPVLLWLFFQWTKGAEGPPEETRATTVNFLFLLPPPENILGEVLPTQRGFPRGKYPPGHSMQQHHTGSPDPSVSPLGILKPLVQPIIRRESAREKLGIWLSCQVPGGTVDVIEWKRDGKPVSVGQKRHLPANLLNLPETEASSCGSYSCNASNSISWKESPLLSVTLGISKALQVSLQIAALALVFAGFSGWGILFPLCQPEKLRIRGKAWTWLSTYTNGLTCLASILAFVALILWSYDQGLSAALILPMFLLLYVMMVTSLVVGSNVFQLGVLHQITDKAVQRMVDFTTPAGLILAIVMSGLQMKCIMNLQDCVDMQRRTAEDRTSRRQKWNELQAFQEGTLGLP